MPTNAIVLARTAFDRGDWSEAWVNYRQELKSAAANAIRWEFAERLWACFEYEEATEHFLQAIESPESTLAQAQRVAQLFFSAGRYRIAAQTMERIVRRWQLTADPVSVAQWASCLERSGQAEKALEILEKLDLASKTHPMVVRQQARIERESGAIEQAILRLENAVKATHESALWMLNHELATAYDRLGDYASAWQRLLASKAELRSNAEPELQRSYLVRQRQAELFKSVTDADLRRWHQTPVTDPLDLILLGGFPRSGTTLLESQLTKQYGVLGTDESGVLRQQFIQPIVWEAADCWQAIVEIRSWDQTQLDAGRREYTRCTAAVVGTALDGRTILEKDPLITCDLTLPLRLFPDAKLIMPLRDPRDTLLSYFFTMVPFGWSSAPAADLTESAKFYHDVMRHWVYIRSRLPWPWHETKYERMVKDPIGELETIAAFLNLKSRSPGPASDTERGVTTPTYADVQRPVYQRSVSRWRHYETHLETVFPVLEPFCRTFGYD